MRPPSRFPPQGSLKLRAFGSAGPGFRFADVLKVAGQPVLEGGRDLKRPQGAHERHVVDSI